MAPAKKTCGILLGGAAFVLLLAGCAPPIPDGGFDAPDPASRLYAAARVAANWSSTQPPDARRPPPIATLRQLVVMLESSDPAERLVASETLQMVTGEDFGYEPSAPLPERFLAVNRWRAWVDSRATPPSPAEGAGT
ncbi:MAG: hypothetical protein O3A19_03040 [Planctomycetota bacterium]|jgi:hypothetical protein|nr:hypothetical protein [Planctomycetota bacterium]